MIFHSFNTLRPSLSSPSSLASILITSTLVSLQVLVRLHNSTTLLTGESGCQPTTIEIHGLDYSSQELSLLPRDHGTLWLVRCGRLITTCRMSAVIRWKLSRMISHITLSTRQLIALRLLELSIPNTPQRLLPRLSSI